VFSSQLSYFNQRINGVVLHHFIVNYQLHYCVLLEHFTLSIFQKKLLLGIVVAVEQFKVLFDKKKTFIFSIL